MTSSSTWAEISGLFSGPGAALTLPWDDLPIGADGPLLDVGAGTGLQTIALAEAYPTREVLAIEPEDGMRIALMTRIADRATLRERVTVYPSALADLPTELRFAAALLHNVVYELPDLDTAFAQLAQRMLPGGSVIINHMHIASTATPVARRLITSTRLGRLRYERWFERRRTDTDRMEVVNHYLTMDGDRTIRNSEERRAVTGLDNEYVADRATEAGFAVDGATAPGYWVLTRPNDDQALT